jgi:malate dehydrogenase
MYADYRFATTNGKSIKDLVNDQVWNADTFLPTVGKRGAAIIAARGLSSAASAANAAIDHIRDWALGSNGEWVTMGVPSNGEYGIPAGIVFGFPVITENGEYKIVTGLEIDAFSQECINKTLAELQGSKTASSTCCDRCLAERPGAARLRTKSLPKPRAQGGFFFARMPCRTTCPRPWRLI